MPGERQLRATSIVKGFVLAIGLIARGKENVEGFLIEVGIRQEVKSHSFQFNYAKSS